MKKKAATMPSGMAGLNERWTVLGVCIFLAAIIWAVFGQTLRYGFFNLDDEDYVSKNPDVSQGLTLKGIVWAFTHVHSFNWHPLTWISHMLDCQFYGLNASGHHLTNILLHTTTAILLFLMLRQMTGFLWRSAFVAAVFAIHPLHVESVAWVSERKDVLSGVFFMLIIAAYVRYVRRPLSPARYGLVMLLFALGLMCKPMLVTLPFILLLLDYWPLNRFEPSSISRLALEKLPLLGLSAASCVVTLYAQTAAVMSFDKVSLPSRVGNALISYMTYLGQMFWPSGLAPFYPFPTNGSPLWETILAGVLLLSISTGVFLLRKTRPYLLAGWLWYLVMLVPVIGILQVGSQARADRYTYLPQIGLYLLLTWAAVDLCARWRYRRWVLGGFSIAIIAALIFCARVQASYWKDSESLWTHTLDCTSDNFIAQNNLGAALLKNGNAEEAITHFQESLQINPKFAEAYGNLGDVLLQKGSVDEAIIDLQQALQVKPDYAEAHNNLGSALFRKGRIDEAITQLQQAVQINPDFAKAHYNIGLALFQKGNVDEAITHYQRALQIKPDYAEAHNNLGNALLQKGNLDEAIIHFQLSLQINPDSAEANDDFGNALFQKGYIEEAITHYEKALKIKPDSAKARNNLAWVLASGPLASLRNGNKAVELAQRANQLTGDGNPIVLRVLAAAYAEAGKFPEAVATAQRALQLAETQSDTALADALRSEIKLYQAGLPFHLH